MASKVWQKAKFRLFPLGVLFIAGIVNSSVYFNVADHKIDRKIIAYSSIFVFVVSAVAFLHSFTGALYSVIANRRLGVGRAAAIQFTLRVIGYLVILLGALELMNISVTKLLLGGAVVGIILGVAAQQALANFFASVILILAHPFRVGEEVIMFSGALGGKYEGVVTDIGLTHTRIRQADGKVVFMPNATLLSGAAIIPSRAHKKRS